MKKVLITGSTGYVGGAVTSSLVHGSDYKLVLPVRRVNEFAEISSCQQVLIKDISDIPAAAFEEVDVVLHLAGKAHDLSGVRDSIDEIRRVNLHMTRMLAELAVSAGVKKFIYLSSIGVCGNVTEGRAFTEESIPHPTTSYAQSKYEAERALRAIVDASSMELVIIRPPLVYSGLAPGNFRRLLRLVSLGLPLPLANLHNNRSIIALDNLVDFIRLCIDHPSSGGNVFLISDEEAVSTEEMVRYLAEGMGKRAFLFGLPKNLVRVLMTIAGKGSAYTQLFRSLSIDSTKARRTLSWGPPFGVRDALVEAGREFSRTRSGSH